MKHIKKIISFLTIICCLAGSVMPTFASGTGDSGGSTGSTGDRVIFINKQERLPYLVVSKKVINKGAVKAPENDDFTFTLERLEDRGTPQEEWRPVVDQTYRVYKVTDTEYAEPIKIKDHNVDVEDRRTESGGTFELQDGQKARFKLEAGQSYRVSEVKKNNYTANPQSRIVDMQLYTQTIEFENSYKINTESDDFRLLVEKRLQFPTGYTPPQTPEFKFQLKIKTQLTFEPYAGQAFTVTQDGQAAYSDVTDSDGIFKLRAGYTAHFDFSEFSENFSNARYQITELPGVAAETGTGAGTREDWAAWWTVEEEEEREGRVNAGMTETFTNANVSFVVKKQLASGAQADPDAEFTFLLTDGNAAWANAPYYLYDEWGNRINNTPVGEEEDGKDQNTVRVDLHKTDDGGRFKLKFGQSALFLGIKPGTFYTVIEDVSDSYRQTDPVTKTGLPDGYRRTVEKDPQSAVFTNEPLPQTGLLVAKTITNPNGEVPGNNAPKFKFRLMKQVAADASDKDAEKIEVPAKAGDPGAELKEDGKYVKYKYVKYEPVPRATYSMGETTGETDGNGIFEMAYNNQALFESLTLGETYRVVEVLDETRLLEYDFVGLKVKSGETELEIDKPYVKETDAVLDEDKNVTKPYEKSHGWQADLTEGQIVSFFFTNSYKPNRVDLELTKINPESEKLAGAVFSLYEDANMEKPVKHTVTNVDTGNDGQITAIQEETSEFTTDADGTLTFENLKPGIYWLREIKAPSGYSLIDPIQIGIDVVMEKNQKKITVTIGDKSFVATGEKEVETKLELVPGVHAVINTDKNDVVKIKVCNIELYELPNSGGMGIYWYSIGGVLLMMAATLILYKNKHRREVLKD